MKKPLLVFLLVFILIVIAVNNSSLRSSVITTSENGNKALPDGQNSTSNSAELTPPDIGNDPANLVGTRRGQFAQRNGYVYRADTGITRENLNGGGQKILATKGVSSGGAYLNVIGDTIYYLADDGIMSMHTDGTNRKRIVTTTAGPDGTRITNLFVVKNRLYYTLYRSENSAMGNFYIYKAELDGTDARRIAENSAIILIAGHWIYYQKDQDKEKFYQMETDGADKTKIAGLNNFGGNADVLNITADEWIYYCDLANGECNIHKIKTNGTKDTDLKIQSHSVIVYNNYIYFLAAGGNLTSGSLYRANWDGSKITKVSDPAGSDGFIAGITTKGLYLNKLNHSGSCEFISFDHNR
ncbi:MAG: DUF5050 domain-containing protein [Firmicutes bacterium]|nr:DUF5050 domain-containing protein [Bacillota bacterium]